MDWKETDPGVKWEKNPYTLLFDAHDHKWDIYKDQHWIMADDDLDKAKEYCDETLA